MIQVTLYKLSNFGIDPNPDVDPGSLCHLLSHYQKWHDMIYAHSQEGTTMLWDKATAVTEVCALWTHLVQYCSAASSQRMQCTWRQIGIIGETRRWFQLGKTWRGFHFIKQCCSFWLQHTTNSLKAGSDQ